MNPLISQLLLFGLVALVALATYVLIRRSPRGVK